MAEDASSAAFLAGVLTHDPGMYPKRLILDDARNFGISVLSLDVNHSDKVYRVERVDPGTGSGGWVPPAIGWSEPERDGRDGAFTDLAQTGGRGDPAIKATPARWVVNRLSWMGFRRWFR